MKKICRVLLIGLFLFSCSKDIQEKNLKNNNSIQNNEKVKIDLKKEYLKYGINLEEEIKLKNIEFIDGEYYINFNKKLDFNCNISEGINYFGKINLKDIYKNKCVSVGDREHEKYLKWFINIKRIEHLYPENFKYLNEKVKNNIKEMSFGYIDKKIDIEKLVEINKNLEVLEFWNQNIEKLEKIIEFEKLKKLELDESKILKTDFSKFNKGLNFLTELEEFTASDVTDFSNLNIVKNSKKLKKFDILLTETIKDIEVLDGFEELEEVNISGNKIKSILPLKKSLKIKKLGIDGNFIENIDVLKQMNNLEVLFISDNKIKDFTPIKNLKNLRVLYFDKIESIEEVKDFLPEHLYKNGKISNDEVFEGKVTEIKYVGIF